MGGYTISNDPRVIRADEQHRAESSIEAAILRGHRRAYPYQAPPPTGAQISAVLTELWVLLRDPEYRPIVLAALGLDGA